MLFEFSDGKPAILGGTYDAFEEDGTPEHYLSRDYIQTYDPEDDKWECCVPSLWHRRSNFVAVNVQL